MLQSSFIVTVRFLCAGNLDYICCFFAGKKENSHIT